MKKKKKKSNAKRKKKKSEKKTREAETYFIKLKSATPRCSFHNLNLKF